MTAEQKSHIITKYRLSGPVNTVKNEGAAMFEDDIFVEEMVVRRKSTLNLLMSIGIVVLAVFW